MSRNWVGAACVIIALNGCSATLPPPRVYAVFTATGNPQPRPDSSPVDFFPKGSSPVDKYEILGTLEIENDSLKHTKSDMMRYARSEVRKMGGDALINMELRWGTTGGVEVETAHLVHNPRAGTTDPNTGKYTPGGAGITGTPPPDDRGKGLVLIKGRVVRWSGP